MGYTSAVDTALQEKLSTFRRLLHRHPELSLEEFETTKRIESFLRDHGVEPLPSALKTGTMALVRGQRPGPCVAVRADIDALPIEEATNLPFASEKKGKMHACGHDFHTAGVLGAVLLAQEMAASVESFAGSILFIFQPAEELGAGANQIMETGVFEANQVRAVIGEHNNPLLPSGLIGVKSGPLMGSVDEFRFVIHGVGGHAAIPQHTVDPILVAAQIVAGLQHVVSRNISPLDSVVVTVGQFQAGTARNIIPMHAVLEGTVRTLQPEGRDIAERRIRSFVEQTAASYGARAEIEYIRELPPVLNDETVAALVREAAIEVVGDAQVVTATPTLGGEDFALYQERLPGCFFWVGTGRPDGTSAGWHHPEFDVDESMIGTTSQVFVAAALRLLAHYATS